MFWVDFNYLIIIKYIEFVPLLKGQTPIELYQSNCPIARPAKNKSLHTNRPNCLHSGHPIPKNKAPL